jgi:hypothetical protein
MNFYNEFEEKMGWVTVRSPISIEAWSEKLETHGLMNFSYVSLDKLPYTTLKKVSDYLVSNWGAWKFYAEKLTKKTYDSGNAFIQTITRKNTSIEMREFMVIAWRSREFPIMHCFEDCKRLTAERRQADKDDSRGFVDDLSDAVLEEISKTILSEQADWRFLADGLGFNNSACHDLQNPAEMLDKWRKKDLTATICRLYFEADQLEMKSLCKMLNEISLEGRVKVALDPLPVFSGVPFVTRFELLALERFLKKQHIKIDWEKLAQNKFGWTRGNENGIRGLDIFWKFFQIRFKILLEQLERTEKYRSAVKKFHIKLLRLESINRSSGGVAAEQVAYLAKKVSCAAVNIENNAELAAGGHIFWGRDLRNSKLIDMQSIRNKVFPGHYLGAPLSFQDFLRMYWQDPALGETLDLRQFCSQILDILKKTKRGNDKDCATDTKLIEAFKMAYDELKSVRNMSIS